MQVYYILDFNVEKFTPTSKNCACLYADHNNDKMVNQYKYWNGLDGINKLIFESGIRVIYLL